MSEVTLGSSSYYQELLNKNSDDIATREQSKSYSSFEEMRQELDGNQQDALPEYPAFFCGTDKKSLIVQSQYLVRHQEIQTKYF